MKEIIEHIYVIEGLKENERHTGKELYEDIISRYNKFYNSSIKHDYFKIHTQQDLKYVLENILNKNIHNKGVIIHFETHGEKEKKRGLVLPDGSLLKWINLMQLTKKLNIKTKHKLHLNLAACNTMKIGAELYLKNEIAPFASYITIKDEVTPDIILAGNEKLYENIIKHQNLYRAYNELNDYYPDYPFKIKDVCTEIKAFIKIMHEKRFKSFLNEIFLQALEGLFNIKLEKYSYNNEEEMIESVHKKYCDKFIPSN